jgi:hypothetical protein
MIQAEQGRKDARPLPPLPAITDPVPSVLIHTLLGRSGSKLVNYSQVTESRTPKKIRILELPVTNTSRWRDGNWVETKIYGEKIKAIITNREAELIKTGCYGMTLIEDQESEDYWVIRDNPHAHGDGRKKYRGLKSSSLDHKKTFPAVIYSVGLGAELGITPDTTTPIEEIDASLGTAQILSGTEEEKRFVYAYGFSRHIDKKELCRLIRERLIHLRRFTIR